MTKNINFDYDIELDILHVFSDDIKTGVNGCLSMGDFNIDISNDNKVVGIEVEEASKVFNLSPDILVSPDSINLIIRKTGNMLFIGVGIIRGEINTTINVTTPANKIPLQVAY